MSTRIADRLNDRFHYEDRDAIKLALTKYCIKEGIDGKEAVPSPDLVDDLLPYLERIDPDWIGLRKNTKWVDSNAHRYVLEHIKNLTKDKGKRINKAIDEYEESGSSSSDDGKQDQVKDQTTQSTRKVG